MNLPSRAQMTEMSERLQAVENQLGEIKALLQRPYGEGRADPAPAGLAPQPKPPRTKRPPSATDGGSA